MPMAGGAMISSTATTLLQTTSAKAATRNQTAPPEKPNPSSTLTATLSRFLAAALFALLFIVQPTNAQQVEAPNPLVCDRHPKVQEVIIDKVSGKSVCEDITAADLAAITALVLQGGFRSGLGEAPPKRSDFAGLTTLGQLEISGNSNLGGLKTLPADLFQGLPALRSLRLTNNQLRTLPIGIFQGLSLSGLALSGNPWVSFPTNIFEELVGDSQHTRNLIMGLAPINAALPVANGDIPAQSLALTADPITLEVATFFSDPDDTLTYTATSATPAIASVAISGSTLTITPVALGTTNIMVTARDTAGQPVTQTFALTVSGDAAADTTAPDAPVITQPTTPTNDDSITISGTAEADATVTLSQNGIVLTSSTATADANGDWSIEATLSADNDGANSFTATAADQAGNVSDVSNSVAVTLDQTKPTIAMRNTSPTNPTNDNPIPINLLFSEPLTGFEASDITVINGTITADSYQVVSTAADGIMTNVTFTITPSADGIVVVRVAADVATDAAGNDNANSGSILITYDGTAPDISIEKYLTNSIENNIPDARQIRLVEAGNIEINGSVETGATVEIFRGTASLGTAAVTDTTWTFDLPLIEGEQTITAKATDRATNIGESTITVTLDTSPSISISPATVTATVGTAIADITIDASAGGAVASYSISPDLNMNTGLDFDLSTGAIFGTPNAVADAVTYTITATNSGGMDTASVVITITAIPIIDISPDTLTATVGTAITPTTIINTGGAVISYGISPSITNGLSFDADTGTISGTPTMAADAVTYTIFATNAPLFSRPMITITVVDAPDISPSMATLTATVGTTIADITIDASAGGDVASYSIAPDISNGLLFDTSTGTISGTPDAAAAAVTYTITANGVGMPTVTASAMVTITVNAAAVAVAAPSISISPATVTATVGSAIADITIDSTTGGGGAVTSYGIAPDIGNGLMFDTTTGTISGTPTAVAEAISYIITATNSGGTATATVAITVNAAAVAVPIISISATTVTATVGTAIADITIDSITGGGGAVASYGIAPDIGNGLLFDATTGTISGTPTAVAEAISYTITATNSGGTATATVAITVNAAAVTVPIISISATTVTATVGTAIADITIDSITGGGGAVASYGIAPDIGNGLLFDATTGTISGTPTAVAEAISYIITATNSAGTATATVAITVNAAAVAAPSISISPATVTATVGSAIADITIDSTTGGGGAVTSYGIAPDIGNGLMFDTTTGTISGTPTAVAEAISYIITATNSGGTATATVAITVNAAAVAVPIISISATTVTATVGTAIADITIDSITGGGGAVASYGIAPDIGNGLLFDASTGTISGTPTAVAEAISYTITATNSGGTATATVAITVNAAAVTVPIISISATTVTATVGTAIADITIDSITGGGGAVASYGIAPDIGNGLLFDATTGTISGTPTAVAEAISYIITATNSAGTATATVAITVNAAAVAAPSISISPATVTATVGTAIADITIDSITGGGGAVASYGIAPDIGNGLLFDASTGTISGTPTAVAEAITYTITATNSGGTATATVAITVNAAAVAVPIISISATTVTATVGSAIADITIDSTTGGGGAVASYGIAPDIGNGLLFDASTGTISGTPTAVAEAITYTITATNSGGTDTATVAITVNAAAVAVPIISISATTVTATVGTAIADITIDSTTGGGGAVASYGIAPDIGNGLLFDASTGTISGTPTAVAEAISYTITATNSGGTATATVAITVNAAPVAVPIISISATTVTATVGTAIADISITSSGGAVASYGIAPDIGNGLLFDATTGTISGTPTAVAEAITYTITATNSGGTDTATVAITVNAAAVAVPSISISATTVTATVGTAIADIMIDSTTGGGGAVASYGIAPDIGNGLLFDASTGTISGTPTAVAEAISYIITATNSGGTATATVAITVNAAPVAVAAPSISISPATVTATVGTAIADISITSSGGAVASYGIAPDIGNGLLFDATTGTISGTPTAVAEAISYTITATNSGGTATATVAITVNAAAVAVPIINISATTVTATVGTAIADISITSSGGAVASYGIAPDIGNGLLFDATTGTISGTPTAVAEAISYIITATNSGGTDTATVAITVNAAAVAVPIISISATTVTATVGTAIADITIDSITGGGGAVASYGIAPDIGNGLLFDASTGTISGTPTAVAEAISYTITATNSGGTATATVAITVNAAPVAVAAPSISISPATVTATVGTAIADISITSSGGAVASYGIAPDIGNGLLFDASTGTISGTPTAVAEAITYTITATNSAGTATATVAITVNAAAVAVPIISISATTVTATVGTAIADISITSSGGAVASYGIAPDIGNGLLFDASTGTISGTPTAVAEAISYIITATNSGGTDTATVAITVNAAAVAAPNSLMGISALNDEALSKLTQGTVASIMTAVSNRMDVALSTGTPPKASYQLDGQTLQLDNQAQLLGYIRSLKDGSMDWKRILSNLSLVLPLNTAGNTAAGSGSRHDLGYGSGLSLWAGGDYLNLDGDSDIDWSGDLFSAQFGIDKRIDKHLLLGTMVSWSEGDADYTQDTNTGSYNHQSLSVHPYLAWSNQGNHLWGSVGYGEGELEIEDNSNSISSDTRLWSFATGAKAGLSKVPGLSLKGDFLWARTDIDNPLVDNALDARIREQSIDSQRLRLLLEFEHTYGLSGGLLRPLIELGMRYDGGDGDTGIGAILGTGLRYTNGGLTMEGKLHTLLGRDDYREWGVQGTIVLDPGLRGQGLAFSLTPGYGYGDGDGDVGVSGSSQIWQGLPKGPRDQGHQNQNYRGRLQANMGYGFFTSGGGLLTPYGEVRLSNSRYYRLGMRWNPNIPFSLNLFGEHQTGNDSIGNSAGNSTGDNNAILLEGQMQF